MPIEVTRVFTTNEAREPNHTFRGGDRIIFRLHFNVTDVPDNTRVRLVFTMRHIEQARIGDIDYVLTPFIWWQDSGLVSGDRSFEATTSWQLPDEDPFEEFDDDDWEDIWDRSWRMQGGRGIWELSGFVGFTEPPRGGELDHSRDNWMVQYLY